VLEYVAGFASSDAGRRAILGLEPSVDPETVQTRLTAVDETGRFLAAREAWALPGFPDAGHAIRRLAVEGSVLSPQELHAAGGLLAAGRVLLGSLNDVAAELPTLGALASRLLAAKGIETSVLRTVDAEGTVLDGASSELKRIRMRLSGAHNRVVAHRERFREGMNDDLNPPQAIAALFEASREANRRLEAGAEAPLLADGLEFFDSALDKILGLPPMVGERGQRAIFDGLLEMIVEQRERARLERDFGAADAIRDRLEALGVGLEDGPEGTRWKFE